jgi:hypothetical protein
MMFDKHVLDRLVVEQIISVDGRFGIDIQVERKLRQQPQFAFDLHPSWTAKKRPGFVCFFDHFNIRTEYFEPYVQDLFVECHANERTEFHVHWQLILVMRLVYCFYAIEEQFFWRQNLIIVFIKPIGFAQDQAGIHAVDVLFDYFSNCRFNE